MKRLFLAAAGMWILVVVPAGLAAGEPPQDREGSKDHSLLRRYEGSSIVQYDHKEFDEYTVPLGKFMGDKFSKSTHLEVDVTRLVYAIPKGRSTLEVMRNYEKEQKANGYTSLLAASGSEADRITSSANPI